MRELDVLSGVSGWRLHDLRRTCVSGMARLGVAPHLADKILNHQSGTISGVAAVYQRHDFLAERKDALEKWAATSLGLSPQLRITSAAQILKLRDRVDECGSLMPASLPQEYLLRL